jgi:hypothetical protein
MCGHCAHYENRNGGVCGVAEQADNDLNEALGIKHTPLLQFIVGIGTGLLIWKSF